MMPKEGQNWTWSCVLASTIVHACGREMQRETRPGDWKCPSCRAYNFAFKEQCFKCSVRKPLDVPDEGSGPSSSGAVQSHSRKHNQDDDPRKLFVASLSYDTTEVTLKLFFERCGKVTSCHLAKDKESGASRGFAFVTFADEACANDALTELDGSELDGRTIKVALSTEGGGSGGGRISGGGRKEHVKGFEPGAEVNVSTYKIETIKDEDQRVVLRHSKRSQEHLGKSHVDGFVYSEDEAEEDPERRFVASLSSKEKRRLLKTLTSADAGARDSSANKEDKISKRDKKEKKEKKKRRKEEKKAKKNKKEKKPKRTRSSSTSSSSSSSSDSDEQKE